MGTTSLGISYPDPSGVPQRAALQTLASTADDAILAATTYQPVAYAPSGSGWTWSNVDLRRRGQEWSFIATLANNTGSAVTADSGGNIGDVVVSSAAMPSGSYSTNGGTSVYMTAIVSGTSTWWLRVNPTGTLSLTHASGPAQSIPNGGSLLVRGLWLVPA